MIKEKREKLKQSYREWRSESKNTCPQFMCENFSHPYYLHIPDKWYERKCRILVVGKEGFGNHIINDDIDEEIENAQKFNREYLESQLGKGTYTKRPSPFWNRIRRIYKLQKSDELAITWTNIDKIHRNGKKNCPPLKKQRLELHRTKILAKELEVLQPDIVIFFGWYDIALEAELPEVYKALKKHDADYPSYWKEHRMKTITEGGIVYIFTNHPNWGQRQKGYEDRVGSEVEKNINKTLKKSVI